MSKKTDGKPVMFRAKYDGQCKASGRTFKAGALVHYRDEGLCLVDAPRRKAAPAKASPAAPRQFSLLGAPPPPPDEDDENEEWARWKGIAAAREREQEREAFLSDPDYR